MESKRQCYVGRDGVECGRVRVWCDVMILLGLGYLWKSVTSHKGLVSPLIQARR